MVADLPPNPPVPWPIDLWAERRRRAREIKVVIAVVLGLAAIEIGVQVLRAPEATVEIVNQGRAPVEDLVLRSDGYEVAIPLLDPNASVAVSLPARRKCDARMTYRQKSSALTGIELADYDPRALRWEGKKLVIILHDGAYERHPEDEPTRAGRAWQAIQDWLFGSS